MAAVHEFDVPLAPLTTLGVGGNAARLLRVRSSAEALAVLKELHRAGEMPLLLGGGSNLVIADAGVSQPVLRLEHSELRVQAGPDGSVLVEADAGHSWDAFVARAVAEGWAGVECLSGIPGQVGSTPIQNVGAYGQEVSETIVELRAFDQRAGEEVRISAEDAAFGYRTSRFKHADVGRFVVLSVLFRLLPGGAPALRYAELTGALEGEAAPSLTRVRDTVLALRRRKSMVVDDADPNTRSCGSFFTNPIVTASHAERVRDLAGVVSMPTFPNADGTVKLAAGWLIERAGFAKGTRRGAVGLSTQHALAVVASAGATAADVVGFAREISAGVGERFEVTLAPEPVFWGFGGLVPGELP